jgi:hypothetical protein
MPANTDNQPRSDPDQLEAAADQAIAACGGDIRAVLKALIVANEFLESEVCELMQAIECLSPAAAIERAQGLWKALGHTGAVAFSRTGDPATGDFNEATVLRKFGDVLTLNGSLPAHFANYVGFNSHQTLNRSLALFSIFYRLVS